MTLLRWRILRSLAYSTRIAYGMVQTDRTIPLAARRTRKIGSPYANVSCRPGPVRCLRVLRGTVAVGRYSFSPDPVHVIVVSRDPCVIAEKRSARIERSFRPGIIVERFAAVARLRQRHSHLAVMWIVAAIIKQHISDASYRVDRHPLIELIQSVMDRIVVDASGRRPGPSAIA